MMLLLCLFQVIQLSFAEYLFNRTGCGDTKGCLFKPHTCIPYIDCAYAFSYVADSSHLFMELFAQLPLERGAEGGYVAVGFSKDALMGGDTVTDCSSFQGRPFTARLSYNPGKSNRRVPLNEDVHNSIVKTIISHYVNGTIYCKIAQLIKPPPNVKEYFVQRLNNKPWILMSSGPTDGEELFVHSLDDFIERFPYSSPGPVSLTDFIVDDSLYKPNETSVDKNISTSQQIRGKKINGHKGMTKNEKIRIWEMVKPGDTKFHETNRYMQQLLTTIHALLMIVSWVVCIPMAILIARYTRSNWSDRTFLGAPLWINAHRFLNISAGICTAISIFCIFYAHGFRWHGLEAFHSLAWEEFHGLFGLIACGFVWFQIFNSTFRCSIGTRLRAWHNALHRSCGFSAFILGITTLGIAFWYLPKFFSVILARIVFVGYIAILALSVFLLEPLKWRLWCIERDKRKIAQTSQTQNVIPKTSSSHLSTGRSTPMQRKQNVIMAQRQSQAKATQEKHQQLVQNFQMTIVSFVGLVAIITCLLCVTLVLFRNY